MATATVKEHFCPVVFRYLTNIDSAVLSAYQTVFSFKIHLISSYGRENFQAHRYGQVDVLLSEKAPESMDFL